MTAPDSLPLHALAEDNLAAASPDLLRAMVKTFADALMSAEADALCNAEYGQVGAVEAGAAGGRRPPPVRTAARLVTDPDARLLPAVTLGFPYRSRARTPPCAADGALRSFRTQRRVEHSAPRLCRRRRPVPTVVTRGSVGGT